MREVLDLKSSLHIIKRIPLGESLSIGEFFSLMENHTKMEFLNKIIDKIQFGKSYVFKIDCIDVEDLDYCWRETFHFTMFEMERGDEVVTRTVDDWFIKR